MGEKVRQDGYTYDVFNPPTFEQALDGERLERQLDRVRDLMLDGRWRSLAEISLMADGPEASISARLRELRRPKHGSYRVERRRRGDPKQGWWEYRVSATPVPLMFDR